MPLKNLNSTSKRRLTGLWRQQTLMASAGAVAVTTALASAPAYAQDGDVVDDSIVVTARKRAESIQDAPLAITAFGSVELKDAAFDNILDVTKAAPGVFVESFNQTAGRVNTTPRFRGVFLSTGNPLQQTAGIFIDGIPIIGGIQGIGVQELERVEIIKGPQSALFGRNTFAGAINYVTQDPGDELAIDATWLAATRGEYRVAGSVEGPLIEDVLKGRLNASIDINGGHYDNIAVPEQELGEQRTWAVSGALLFEPTDRFRAKLRGHYYQDNDGPAAVQETLGFESHNFGGFPIVNGVADTSAPFDGPPLVSEVTGGTSTESVFKGTIRRPALDTIGLNTGLDTLNSLLDAFNSDPRSADVVFPAFGIDELDQMGLRRNAYRLSGDFSFDLTDDITFAVLAGYNDEEIGVWTDFDQTEDASFSGFLSRSIEDVSVEARLSGTAFDDRLEWSVGGNYIDIDIESLGATANTFGGTFFFSGVFSGIERTGAKTLAAFGSFDYALTDQISVIFEGRYQSDEISEDGVNAGLATPISPATIEKFLPRAILQYQPTDSTQLYFNWSVGNLPGGFNPEVGELDQTQLAELLTVAPGAAVTFDEEKLVNYEIGWKQTALDNRLAFNLAGFFMRRSDEIFRTIETVVDTDPNAPNPRRTVAFNANGATTNIFGVELDAAYDVSDNLSLQGSFGYVNAKIDSFPAGEGAGDFGDIFGPQAEANGEVSGQQAPRFPPITASAGATYEQAIAGANYFDAWYTRADVFYTGKYYDENSNVAQVEDAYDINLRAGLRNDNVRVEFFVTNLLDESAPAAADNFADLSFAVRTQPGGFFDFSREGTTIALRPRRQFGGRVTLSF